MNGETMGSVGRSLFICYGTKIEWEIQQILEHSSAWTVAIWVHSVGGRMVYIYYSLKSHSTEERQRGVKYIIL